MMPVFFETQSFAKAVHLERWGRGLTMLELSKKTGIEKTKIWRIENATHKMEVGEFFSLCHVLQLAPGDFVSVDWRYKEGVVVDETPIN